MKQSLVVPHISPQIYIQIVINFPIVPNEQLRFYQYSYHKCLHTYVQCAKYVTFETWTDTLLGDNEVCADISGLVWTLC